MSASAVTLSIIFGIIGVGFAIGFFAGSRYEMDLEQWTVAAIAMESIASRVRSSACTRCSVSSRPVRSP